jgi:predicted transcriptional regulator|tara:strand:+ start:1796 stop:1993 length:198 start_codon:yes stop_codon:yes gene_type:complete
MGYVKKIKITNSFTGEVVTTTEDKIRGVMSYVTMLSDALELSEKTIHSLITRLLKGETVEVSEII